LLSAKNSPPRLNTTIARPFTCASLRVPGGMSATAATTCLAISRAGRAPSRCRNRSCCGALRSSSAAARRTDRRNPSADSRWRTGSCPSRSTPSCRARGRALPLLPSAGSRPRNARADTPRARAAGANLVLHSLPVLAEPPAEGRNPSKTCFDHHDLDLGIGLEHPPHDRARDGGGQGGRVLGNLLDIERRPAGVAHGAAARAEDVNADRKAGFDRRLEDRPITPLAEKLASAAQKQNVREAAIARALPNLRAGHFAILIGNDDRGLEPWIAPVPAFELVVVGGERHGGAELVVLLALPRGRERIHDAPFDAVEIEVLLAHEVEIARRQAAAGRPGVAPRGERLALGIGKA